MRVGRGATGLAGGAGCRPSAGGLPVALLQGEEVIEHIGPAAEFANASGAKRARSRDVGADRGYDTRDFVQAVRARGVTPHVARNDYGRRSAIDGRTTRHAGYGRSLRQRKLVEEVFGWLKTVGGGRWAVGATSDGSAIAPGWS